MRERLFSVRKGAGLIPGTSHARNYRDASRSVLLKVQHENRIDVVGGYLVKRLMGLQDFYSSFKSIKCTRTPLQKTSLIQISFWSKEAILCK